MTDRDGENRRLRALLQRMLEAETGEDSMICHDGGFRYSGDFMSMESEIIDPAALVSSTDYRQLKDRGLIAESDGGVQVTPAGRRFAHEEAR